MARQSLPQKLNICIVADKFPIIGLATDHGFLWPVARGLVKRGHQVTVLSWKNPQGQKEITKDGVRAFFLGEHEGRELAPSFSQFPELAFRKFEKLHRETPFHLLHSIDANGMMIARRKKHFGIGAAYDVESTELSQIFSILGYAQESLASLLRTGIAVSYTYLTTYLGKDRKLLKTADGVFVTSPQQKLALERYYLYPDRKTYVVPYGIEIGDLSPREKSEELRKKLGIPGNGHIVVTVTDMMELGELQTLLRAFEKLAIKKPASRLIIVGNGPLKTEIEYEMLMLALGNKVIFTGAVNAMNLSEYIALADIFVNLSARTSGFEASVLEAMAQKKVIIGSEVSPLATVVEDGKDGFLLRPADTGALAELLVQICAEELPTQQIGESARNKVMNLFDMDKMLNQTLDAYQKTLINTGRYKKQAVLEAPPA